LSGIAKVRWVRHLFSVHQGYVTVLGVTGQAGAGGGAAGGLGAAAGAIAGALG
jgi:hypothetical protein